MTFDHPPLDMSPEAVAGRMRELMSVAWQPIETAPKDGSPSILVADAKGWVKEASWHDAWYGDWSRPGWMIANCDEEYGCYVEATHWMPLPKPPSD